MNQDSIADRPSVFKSKTDSELAVSNFDRTSVFLKAAIILVGILVAVLFTIWVTSGERDFTPRTRYIKQFPQPLLTSSGIDPNEGQLNLLNANPDDLHDPGEELPEIKEPALEKTLQAVTEATSSVMAKDNLGNDSRTGSGGTPGRIGQTVGPSIENGGEPKRWKVAYEAADLDSYARQLDFFDLEIGVVQKSSNVIHRVSGLSQSAVVTATERSAEQTTLRFEHEQMRMRRWDRKLAGSAGVDLEDAVICTFYPETTRALMRKIESEYASRQGKSIVDIRRTTFAIVPRGNGYAFEVDEMQFHF